MARKNAIIACDIVGNTLMFTVNGAGEFNLDTSALTDDIRWEALLHGLRQKVSDGAAIPRDQLPDDAGEAAAMKLAAMQEIANRLLAGDWSARRGDGSAPVAGIIYRAFEEWAMARAAEKGATISAEQVRASYDARDRAAQLALRNVPAIADIIARMKAERGGASTIDADAILADLGI